MRLPARTALLALALAAACNAQAQQQRPEVAQAWQAEQAKVIAWRRDIHQHPELGNRETRTSKLVADHLKKLGLEVKTGIATTGVIAVLHGGKPGPRVALRADMDALPVTERNDLPFASHATAEYRGQKVGVMHACGHDGHTAILMGVAEALAAQKKDLPGEVLFVFQPAEEGAPQGEKGGAEEMLAEGIFKEFKPDAVFGLHVFANVPVGKIAVRPGPEMAAADDFWIKVQGRQAHGSTPWRGIDPIVTAADIVTTAQTIVSRRTDISKLPAVLSFGAVNAGIRFNIIPDSAEMVGTIRTFDTDVQHAVWAQLKDVAEHVAAANGATVETRIPNTNSYPVTVNNPDLTAKTRPSLEAIVGKDNVVDSGLIMGAEDFSFYAQQAPGVFFFVGATPKDQDPAKAASNHSPDFFLDEGALDIGFRSLLQVTLDYLHGNAANG